MKSRTTSALSQLARHSREGLITQSWYERVAYSSDASMYQIIPEAVARPTSLAEIQLLFEFANKHKIPLCFRASGTSLNGQTITHGIVVDVSRAWNSSRIEKNGEIIFAEPGVIGTHVNRLLKPFHRKIGPDPASIDVARIGGIIANNSSGMCCGVEQNSYQTIASAVFVLPNGAVIDTAEPDADAVFKTAHPELYHFLADTRQRILENSHLREKISKKYALKNTTGYSLNAFIDFVTPLDIFLHLLVGSEGTLAFLASVRLRTVENYAERETGLLFFQDTESACEAIRELQSCGANVIEFLDRASLGAVEHSPGIPPTQHFDTSVCALLVEFQAHTLDDLQIKSNSFSRRVSQLRGILTYTFSRDAVKCAQLWKVRKGLYPSVGSFRKSGTVLLTEDIAFPLEHLARGIQQTQHILSKYSYDEAVVFGHAKDGNLHFLVSQNTSSEAEIQRYDAMMNSLAELVLDCNGSLKAEHGTGRNMASFVATEWGEELYEYMKQLKKITDPNSILNPDVLISENPRIHLENIKSIPELSGKFAVLNSCIECGFCEPVCPSRHTSTTPRGRIALLREVARTATDWSEIEDEDLWAINDTCATDGLCSLACPVGINTGTVVKSFREERASEQSKVRAQFISKHTILTEKVLRVGLDFAKNATLLIGEKAIETIMENAHKLSPKAIPVWNSNLFKKRNIDFPSHSSESESSKTLAIIVQPCLQRLVASNEAELLQELCRRAGIFSVTYLQQGTCCGMAFASKGFAAQAQEIAQKFDEHLLNFTKKTLSKSSHKFDKIVYVMTGSSCSSYSKQCLDAVEFSAQFLVPFFLENRILQRKFKHVGVHVSCSLRQQPFAQSLLEMMSYCAEKVSTPEQISCCGFAGDRGLFAPELSRNSSAQIAEDFKQLGTFDAICSSNYPCETALSGALNQPVVSFLDVLIHATDPHV